MRKIWSSLFTGVVSASLMVSLMGLSACSAPSDGTPNRMDDKSTDPNYPPAPYGYITGSTVENYRFSGKSPTNGDYTSLPMRDLRLGEFHADANVKLLLIEGSANWCYFCNEEAPIVEKLAEEEAASGFRAMTVLAEGFNRGTPSTPDDLESWVSKHDFKQTIMGIDPESRLFQYAPASAFPLHILINTKTMQIEWLCVGGVGGCNTEREVTNALKRL